MTVACLWYRSDEAEQLGFRAGINKKMKCVPVSSPPTYDVKGSILYGEAKGGGLLQSSIGWMAVGCRLGDGCQRAVQFPKSPERDNLPRVIDFVQKHPVSPPLAAIG